MTYAVSTTKNLKIIRMIHILKSFLDLSIEVHNRKLTTGLFDKKVIFPFFLSCIPYDSNIPFPIFYASIGSEFLCFTRPLTDLINMVTHVNLLLIQMERQGSECTSITSSLKKIFGKLKVLK